jgi:NADH:ubiquinone oxidoreductase subunit 5 (subunit L)/multisubunit Na+/H+ antiporter MnhA subunit
MNVKELLEQSVRESSRYVQQIAKEDTSGLYADWPLADRSMAGGSTAWPARLKLPDKGGNAKSGKQALTPSQIAHERGEKLTRTFGVWAFAIGILAAVLIYLRGYNIARRVVKFPPIGIIHRWLYHQMYFDELYFGVFVAFTVFVSRLAAWIDRHVVDGLVNGAAWLVRETARGAGASDHYVIDGAVDGVGQLAQGLGAAVRTPQTGRIRLYVLILFTAVALGLGAMVAMVVLK